MSGYIERVMTEPISTVQLLKEIGIDTLDWEWLQSDSKLLDQISASFPQDNHLDRGDFEQLLNKAVNAINICDRWVPILHVVLAEVEVKRDKAKNKSYLGADEKREGKLTADIRKALAEDDDLFTELRLLFAKIQSIKMYFERKGKTATAAFFYFKQQYFGYENKGNRYIVGGEEPGFTETDTAGEIGWNNE